MFCPECGSLLKTKHLKKNAIEKFCSCGYSEKSSQGIHIKEKIKHKKEEIFIHKAENPLANYKHECKKCGFDKAYIVQQDIAKVETWSRCEPNRIEIVCGKCGFRERLE